MGTWTSSFMRFPACLPEHRAPTTPCSCLHHRTSHYKFVCLFAAFILMLLLFLLLCSRSCWFGCAIFLCTRICVWVNISVPKYVCTRACREVSENAILMPVSQCKYTSAPAIAFLIALDTAAIFKYKKLLVDNDIIATNECLWRQAEQVWTENNNFSWVVVVCENKRILMIFFWNTVLCKYLGITQKVLMPQGHSGRIIDFRHIFLLLSLTLNYHVPCDCEAVIIFKLQKNSMKKEDFSTDHTLTDNRKIS